MSAVVLKQSTVETSIFGAEFVAIGHRCSKRLEIQVKDDGHSHIGPIIHLQ